MNRIFPLSVCFYIIQNQGYSIKCLIKKFPAMLEREIWGNTLEDWGISILIILICKIICFYWNINGFLIFFLSHHREIKYKCRCLSFFFVYSHLKKRSFELLQNEVKYRILLVSKSLPFKSLTLVSVCVLTRKKNHCDLPHGM